MSKTCVYSPVSATAGAVKWVRAATLVQSVVIYNHSKLISEVGNGFCMEALVTVNPCAF